MDEKRIKEAKKIKEIGTKDKPIKTSWLSHIPILWGWIILPALPIALGVVMLMGMIDLASMLAGIEGLSAELQEMIVIAVPVLLIALGVAIFIAFTVRGYRKSRAKYIVSECMLLQMKGKKDVCKLIFKPGMSVSVKRYTIKSWLCGYGDVVIHLGPGEVGEVTLHNVKNPKRVKQNLDVIIKNNCTSFARTMVFNV